MVVACLWSSVCCDLGPSGNLLSCFLFSQRGILGTEQSKCDQVCEILLALPIKRCSHGNKENLAYFGYSWARGKVMWPFSSGLNLKQSGTDVLGDKRIRYPTLSPSRPSPQPSSTQALWVWGLRLAVCKESWGRNGLTKDKCWTTWKVALSLFQPGSFSSVPKIPDRVVLFHGAAA